jgi:pyrimidine-nucleoside phosphorylase
MVDDPTQLPQAPVITPVVAVAPGYVQRIDAREIGLACVALGGGRQKKGDPIDHRVGIIVQAKVGDQVAPGDLLCTIHAADQAAAETVTQRIRAAYTLSNTPQPPLPMIYERVASR